MNIWILTIGSSDVQLKANSVDKWKPLFEKVKNQCNNLVFSVEASKTEPKDPIPVPARVMGLVYGGQLDKHYNHLAFPLIDAFSQQLIEKDTPDKIIVLLTDQREVFDEQKKRSKKCPYWQDTCTLKPILKNHLQEKFPSAEQDYSYCLQPQSGDNGLDDWDRTLQLVKQTLSRLQVNEKDTIYVSHQAGTPAISSAVQFISLAKFGKQVKFVVSNEYHKSTNLIPSPKYLWEIKLQEVNALLERYDYDGVQDILKSLIAEWDKTSEPQIKEIRDLLEIAINWNLADFDKFKTLVEKRGEPEKNRVNTWWWSGYEAGYLAVVRLEQGNIVEAMFHSFRALEGLAIKYAACNNQGHLYSRKVFDYLKQQKSQQWNNHQYIKELVRSDIKDKATRNDILDKRNDLFHQIQGFKEQNLYDAWKATDTLDWKNRVLGCLNFISGESFSPPLETASLMYQVQQKLKDAIALYQPTP